MIPKKITFPKNLSHKHKTRLKWTLLLIVSVLVFCFSSMLISIKSYSNPETAIIKSENSKAYTSNLLLFPKVIAKNKEVHVTSYHLGWFQGRKVLFAKIKYQNHSYLIDSTWLNINQNNPINAYIQSIGYPKGKMVTAYVKAFSQIPYLDFPSKPKGIIIHDTGTESTSIDDEVTYMTKNYPKDGVFVHTFIDSQEIRKIAKDNFMAQGAGPKANPHYIQFEMPHEYSPDGFALQLANAAYYSALMLKKYQLPLELGQVNGQGSLWSHEMVSLYLGGTDHVDPSDYWNRSAYSYFNSTYTMADFLQLVQAYYNQLD